MEEYFRKWRAQKKILGSRFQPNADGMYVYPPSQMKTPTFFCPPFPSLASPPFPPSLLPFWVVSLSAFVSCWADSESGGVDSKTSIQTFSPHTLIVRQISAQASKASQIPKQPQGATCGIGYTGSRRAFLG